MMDNPTRLPIIFLLNGSANLLADSTAAWRDMESSLKPVSFLYDG